MGHKRTCAKLLTDKSANIVWQGFYQAFGEVQITTETVKNNLRFPGQVHDEEINLYQNYHRDYNPNLGRYLQTDPIGLAGGINTYGYAGQSPLMFVDELGLKGYCSSLGECPEPSPPPICNGTWYQFGSSLPFNVLGFCLCYWECIPCGNDVGFRAPGNDNAHLPSADAVTVGGASVSPDGPIDTPAYCNCARPENEFPCPEPDCKKMNK
ncbi:RHS repeat domain-containing protein [Ostreibacterium oceani]|uniref:RHS repeat-associated core domain-containing protein n=1 Tax=Ostreibacterium oceani TaxID=2654998 RepID=A0A6N7EWK5_9GAMM|nr:RHS repeat-associated core domain-containing protein [Ostreibacterium oceani]MPV85799.1 hypothetical protein [Ostreibacterium oceani]